MACVSLSGMLTGSGPGREARASMPASERMRERLPSASLMGEVLLGRGQRVPGHFVESFTELQWGRIFRVEFGAVDWSSVLERPCHVINW